MSINKSDSLTNNTTVLYDGMTSKVSFEKQPSRHVETV